MYATINDIIGSKRINLSYPIRSGRKITVASMLSGNVQYWSKEPIDVLLKTGEKMVLNKGVYMEEELDSLIGTELRLQMIDSREDLLRTNKLDNVMKVVISLNELDNSDNPEDGYLATPYLRIMRLVLNILHVSNHPLI